MRKIWLLSAAPVALLTSSVMANAADLIRKAPPAPPPPLVSEWTIEAGGRYWFSNGRMQKDLFDPFIRNNLNSRLSYNDMNAHAGETFGRFDHRSGLMVKANLGVGNLFNGTLHDEDFPGAVFYSNTVSDMKDGRMRYGSADVGWNVLNLPGGKLGGYVGYRYFYERGNGFGCRQIATDFVCVPTISTQNLGLSETETWRGAAVGLNTQVNLTDRVRLEVDAGVLPYVTRSGFDNHWFRPDINPQMEVGHGWGTQFEAILSYAVTPQWNVGVGGRYWYFRTKEAHTQFPGLPFESPMVFTAERYGGFLQASYKFDSTGLPFNGPGPLAAAPAGIYKAPPAMIAPVWSWTGIYIGGHVGGGWGRKEWDPRTGILRDPNNFPFIGWANVDGFIGGGQIGANYQIGKWVLGIEADASWADLDGYAPCAAFYTCHTRVDSLGTVAGRLGYAYGNVLFYSKLGGAWAHDKHDANARVVLGAPNEFTASPTRRGWMAGSGVEYGFTPNWSAKIEYNYLSFGTKSIGFRDQFGNLSDVDIKQNIHDVKLGVNYKFGWGAPVVAKY